MASTKLHSTRVLPTQVWDEKVRRTPIPHARTRRMDQIATVTSDFGGKFVPLAAVPLLREDGVLNSRVNVSVQMAELSNMILNPVRVSAMAFVVPKLALERFQDMGTIDRSYNGIPEVDGQVVKWFETEVFDETAEIWQKLGLHAGAGANINTDYLESYNCIWNYIAAQRSPSLTPRDQGDDTIAPAFWEHTQMKHVKPTFDDAMMAGQVPLTFVGGSLDLPVISTNEGNPPNGNRSAAGANSPISRPDGNKDWTGQIWAELTDLQSTISVANIDLARETATWARLRNQFQGVSEEWMIDQLLQGMRVNDSALQHPIMLDHGEAIIGMNERYATDAANLSESVTDGNTTVSLDLRFPPLQCGGTLMICAQVLPEQIYERVRDHYLVAQTVDELPQRTRDELDPQPVDLVRNSWVDEKHTLPDDLFGYEPLNARWQRRTPRLGGKYYKTDPSAPWTEDRNRIWSTDVVDPELGTDFYLSTTLTHEVFADSQSDPFEFWVGGTVNIEGLTFFGPALLEGQDDYDKTLEQVDTTRLIGDGTDT